MAAPAAGGKVAAMAEHDGGTAPIVVGYDGSAAADAALSRAIDDATAARGRLVVVTVAPLPVDVESPMTFGTLGDSPPPVLPAYPPPEVERLLADARDRVDAAGLEADYVWEAGEPAGALVREARDRGAAALFVGKGHHSRLGRWLGTDVAAEVERAAGCRVVVVDA
jgi:nucleotide-binding universal stress UspA family protein